MSETRSTESPTSAPVAPGGRTRGIPFSGPMVRALLREDNPKTQMRRVLKPQPPSECHINFPLGNESWLPVDRRSPLRHHWEAWSGPLFHSRPAKYLCGVHKAVCPYGVPGDLFYVQETWGCPPADHPRVKGGRKPEKGDRIVYRAHPADAAQWDHPGHPGIGDFVWRASTTMPMWAARIWRRITAVRAEQVQDISEEDARAEGMLKAYLGDGDEPFIECPQIIHPRTQFRNLWNSLHGPGAWARNDWVWVLTFEHAEAPHG